MLNLQYTNSQLFGQNFVAQLFWRDEVQNFYPFPRPMKNKVTKVTEVTEISASQQNTHFYGGKFTFNSQPGSALALSYGLDIDQESFNANQRIFDLHRAKQSGGLQLKTSYAIERYAGYTTSNIAPFLQLSYDINSVITLDGGVRYQYTKNKVNDFVGIAQQQAMAQDRRISADAVPGGETAYNNLLFNAGLLLHFTENQQGWFNFSQGFEIPDIAKYYGNGSYAAKVNNHYPLLRSVNINDTKLKGIKINSFELGWRYLTDSLYAQLAAYYSLSDSSYTLNKTDLTIIPQTEKRRIYGIEGAADYRFADSDWSVGSSFNFIRSEIKSKSTNSWEKWSVDYASPSKMTAWVSWAPDDWVLRLQSQQSFQLSDAKHKSITSYNTLDFLVGYTLAQGKLNFSVENLLDKDYVTIWGQRAPGLYSPNYGAASLYTYKGRGRTFSLNYTLEF